MNSKNPKFFNFIKYLNDFLFSLKKITLNTLDYLILFDLLFIIDGIKDIYITNKKIFTVICIYHNHCIYCNNINVNS